MKSFKYNITTGTTTVLPDLPDNRGKIAAGANRIKDTIYIAGGYHVFSNGSEVTSTKMHRYDIVNNVYLLDAPDIPVGTDDHVQAVWRDSLIFLVTGWNNVGNIPDVQVYSPYSNSWSVGTSVPNTHDYKSFGASGTIVGDTIYYFGGAASNAGFNIQEHVRKGVINPNDPTQIDWSIFVPDQNTVGYRMACLQVEDEIHWVGGSEVTYNFDGIAYNGSGGVSPSNRDLYSSADSIQWQERQVSQIPMDLRGIAKINDTVAYLAGGMLADQKVTNKVFKLKWPSKKEPLSINPLNRSEIVVYPNPTKEELYVKLTNSVAKNGEVVSITGKTVMTFSSENQTTLKLPLNGVPKGVYFLKIHDKNHEPIVKKFIKH